MNKDEILMQESDILKGILECAGGITSDESYSFIDVRKGEDESGAYRRVVTYSDEPLPFLENERVLVRFRVRGLLQDEYNKCKEEATKYVRNKQYGGIKMPVDTDVVKFYDKLIYTATHDEDKAKIWDNKDAWKPLNIVTGSDMVSKLLLAGEKDAIIEVLDKKSGFASSLEEVAKK